MDKNTIDSNKRDSVRKNYDLIAEQYGEDFGTYIEDLDIYDVYNILQTNDGVKYLIDYFEEMKENDHLSYCIEIGVINYEDYDRIDGKILPGLSKLSKDQAKNNKNHNKISIDRGR